MAHWLYWKVKQDLENKQEELNSQIPWVGVRECLWGAWDSYLSSHFKRNVFLEMFCFYFKTLPVSWAFMLQSLSSRCSSLKIILQLWPSFLPERRLSQDCIQSISLHCVYDWIWAEHPLHVTRQQCEVSPVWEWCTYTHTATDSVQSVASSATQSLSLSSPCVWLQTHSQPSFSRATGCTGLQLGWDARLRLI